MGQGGWTRLGPGLLFAGAAIGTSHLVQATRAGALYGLGLLLFILFANALKYPSFRAGPAYAAATGHSLLTGYQKQGPWALALIVLTQFPVQVIILAASALTCAGLLGALGFKTPLAPPALGAVLLVLAWLLVRAGGLRGLIQLSRLFVATLTVTTLLATALVLPDVSWTKEALAFPPLSTGLLLFLVALLGLMPAALDLSILHSLWAVADRQPSREDTTGEGRMAQTLTDFKVGYIGSAVLAGCFVVMGAGVMHSEAIAPEPSAVGFAKQVIGLYAASLGDGAAALVAVAALGVMFTTLLTIIDGFPRVHSAALMLFQRGEEEPGPVGPVGAVLVALATGLLLTLLQHFLTFIDFMTTAAFLVGPLIAVLNHRVLSAEETPAALRPSAALRAWSLANCLALTVLAGLYLLNRLGAMP